MVRPVRFQRSSSTWHGKLTLELRARDPGGWAPRARTLRTGLFEGFGSGCGEARALCNTECCKVPCAILFASFLFISLLPTLPSRQRHSYGRTCIYVLNACHVICIFCSLYMYCVAVVRCGGPSADPRSRSSFRRRSPSPSLVRKAPSHYPITVLIIPLPDHDDDRPVGGLLP